MKAANSRNCAAQELREINASILEFANQKENRALQPKTRSYCTPFRGQLFGESMQDAVATALAQRRVDVLILGANPNDSADKDSINTKYRSLSEQMNTGFYSEAHWDDHGRPVAGWSPFTDGKPGWKFLLRAITRAGYSPQSVAMANYLPWGSKDIEQFAAATEPTLLRDVVDFADQLLIRIIQLLRPRVVIAPFSVTEGKHLRTSALVKHLARATHHRFNYAGKSRTMAFNVYSDVYNAGATETILVHVRHPSSIRVKVEALHGIEQQLAAVLSTR